LIRPVEILRLISRGQLNRWALRGIHAESRANIGGRVTWMKYTFALIMLFLAVHPASTSYSSVSAPNSPFDTYGDLCFEDEKAHLDNFAIALQQNPNWVGYVVVYAGRQSCLGEAWYRASRAKKWVVNRGVEANRIILRDAGYEENVTTSLQPWPKDKAPFEVLPGFLHRSVVKIFRHCQNRILRPGKCSNR